MNNLMMPFFIIELTLIELLLIDKIVTSEQIAWLNHLGCQISYKFQRLWP